MADDVTAELSRYNLFELEGERTQITYSTSSIDGRPRLHYAREGAPEREFAGDEIAAARTALGIQLTAAFATEEEETVTLVLPTFAPAEVEEPRFRGFAVITFAKPLGAPGPRQTYFLIPLDGVARSVEF